MNNYDDDIKTTNDKGSGTNHKSKTKSDGTQPNLTTRSRKAAHTCTANCGNPRRRWLRAPVRWQAPLRRRTWQAASLPSPLLYRLGSPNPAPRKLRLGRREHRVVPDHLIHALSREAEHRGDLGHANQVVHGAKGYLPIGKPAHTLAN